jgi:hypothetical protein
LREGRGTAGERPVATIPPALPANSLPSPRLILIGTVHGDPAGYGRALKLLSHLQPDLISVEISRFSLRYRRGQESSWQRLLGRALQELPAGASEHLAIRRLVAQVAMPFEVRAARDWGGTHGIPWRPLDLGSPARRHLPRYARELFTPDNLQALLTTAADQSLEDFVAAQFRRARLAYLGAPRRLFPANDGETRRRERFLARRLRRLAGHGGRLVHLGGWEHLVDWQDGGGLWPEVQGLKPWRLLLDEADAIPVRGR